MPVKAIYARLNWKYYVSKATAKGECLEHWIKPRWIYEGATGKILPPEVLVCHTCDNPACINVAHMWEGTQVDNMQDALKKGRHPGPKNFEKARAVAHANASERAKKQWAPGGSLRGFK